jgi:ABC-type lipoprotein export system ATPase subunit
MPSKQASERARANLDLVGIGDLADAKARQLSGGELQRLAVARALTSTRPIVLADEPTNQLDRHNARRVMQALVDSAAIEHRCVLVVTHDHEALPDTATVVRLAEDGLHAT